MTNTIADLRKLVPMRLGPTTDGWDFIRLRCYCQFEGHGRASEDWEEHWMLELPAVQHHWHSTTGWREGEGKDGMSFHGKTAQQVIDAALAFMRWLVAKEPK